MSDTGPAPTMLNNPEYLGLWVRCDNCHRTSKLPRDTDPATLAVRACPLCHQIGLTALGLR